MTARAPSSWHVSAASTLVDGNPDRLRRLLRSCLQAGQKYGEAAVVSPEEGAVVLGHGFGALLALEAVRLGIPDVRGVCTFHGPLRRAVVNDDPFAQGLLDYPHPESQMYTKGAKVLLAAGRLDPNTPANAVENLELEMLVAGLEFHVDWHAVGNARGNFSLPGTKGYREEADRAATRRLQRFLREMFPAVSQEQTSATPAGALLLDG